MKQLVVDSRWGTIHASVHKQQKRLCDRLARISRERVELALTAILALILAELLNSSPVMIAMLAIGLAFLGPCMLVSPLSLVFLLVIFLPFHDIHVISIIHLKRLMIWASLAYLLFRRIPVSFKNFSRSLTAFTKAAAGFALALIISVAQTTAQFSVSPTYTEAVLTTIVFSDALVILDTMIMVYVAYFALDNIAQIFRLIDVMLLVSAVIAVLGIMQYYSGGAPGGLEFLFRQDYRFYGRATSVFLNPNGLGGFLAPMVVLATLTMFLQQSSWRKRIGFALPVLAVDFWATFLSFSRMAMVQILFGFLIYGILYYYKIGHRKFTWKFAVIVGINLALLISASQFYERYAQLRVGASSMQPSSMALDRIKAVSDVARIHAAKTALRTFGEYPFFGIGYGRLTRERTLSIDWVENQYLKILAEMGLFGFLPFVFLFGIIALTGSKIGQRSQQFQSQRQVFRIVVVLLLTGIATYAFGYFFVDSLSDYRLGYVWILTGALFSLEHHQDEKISGSSEPKMF